MDVAIDKRNRDYLTALADRKKQERDEDLAAEECLRAYKEKLKAGVLKRLAATKDVQKSVESKLKDAKHNVVRDHSIQDSTSISRQNKKREDKKIPLTEEEKQKKREIEEKFKDRHAQYLENIAKKNRLKEEAEQKLEQDHKKLRTKLAKAVLDGNKNDIPPPVAPSSPCPSPLPLSSAAGDS